jgi:CRISPR/Cas system-associated exonuclease Cas4 (RecB family)
MPNSLRSGALYDAISADNVERVFEHWHASSIAECPRSHYLKRLGTKRTQEPTAAKILRWNAGHAIEEVIRPFIEKIYGKTESNVRLTSTELDLTGEYDNLTLKDHRLIEVKSVHDLAFYDEGGTTSLKEDTGQKGPRGGKVWRAKQSPYLHHELQQHAYVLLLEETGITVTNIDYVYVSLSGRLVVYSTKVQPELLEAVKRRLEVLRTAWETKTPPPCICKDYDNVLYDGVLKWCDFKNESAGTCCELTNIELEGKQ